MWERSQSRQEVRAFGIYGLSPGMYRVTSTLMDARGQKHSAIEDFRVKLPKGSGGVVAGSDQGAIVKPIVRPAFARTVGGGIAAV
jgi:hypothetical protein